MTSRPITMREESVRGILREIERPGSGKTQTRRLAYTEGGPSTINGRRMTGFRRSSPWQRVSVGDLLWVREPWRVSARWDGSPPRELPARQMTVFFPPGGSIANLDSADDWRPDSWPSKDAVPDWVGKLRQARHMPAWASRLTLEVVGTSIQRLHDIGIHDAVAEGMDGMSAFSPVAQYEQVWTEIHGASSWRANPVVVVINFRPMLGNVRVLRP